MYNPHLHFHFTGIGGSGMSGIAEVLLNLGFKVSGSDLRGSSIIDRLVKLGAAVSIGHAASNIPEGTSLVVYSSAVTDDNVEVCEARRRGLPLVARAAVLAELMRLKFGVAVAGSHGKTTTTSMIATVMESAGLDPTVIIGGQVRAGSLERESGGRLGRGQFLVAESDESDRSFLLLKPTLAVITNIDAEHLAAYGSLIELERSFEQFVSAVPFYGLAVFCVDDPRVRDLSLRYAGRKVTYGVSPDADFRAEQIGFDRGVTRYEVWRGAERIADVALPMPGRHFAVNSLASFAVGAEFSISPQIIAAALGAFPGVRRRIEVLGEGRGVTVINDYGHHPTEIQATLRAVRDGWCGSGGRVHVLFQPHRYTRTQSCFAQFLEAFHDSDTLVTTEIYSAGEPPLEGISGQSLSDAINHRHKAYVHDPRDAIGGLARTARSGDVVVCLGAGSVGAVAPEILTALVSSSRVAQNS